MDIACAGYLAWHVERLQVRSGRDWRVLWELTRVGTATNPTFDLGVSMLGDIDLDGDRRPDLLVVELPYDQSLFALYAYRHDGTLLYRVAENLPFPYRYPLWNGRHTLGRLGADRDGDGIEDILLGGYSANPLEGAVVVLSGRTGQFLLAGTGIVDGMGLGYSACGTGDIDGDGFRDFVGGSSTANLSSRGMVRVFSGRTGAPIHTWYGRSRGCEFGRVMRAELDLDQDGVDDVVVGAMYESYATPPYSGGLHGFSGRDGRELFWMHGYKWGYDLQVLRPFPGNPFPSFVHSMWEHYQGEMSVGLTQVFRGAAAGLGVAGSACAGTLPQTPGIGIGPDGPNTLVHVTRAAPGQPVALLLGLSGTSYLGQALPWSLDPLGLMGCQLHNSVDLVVPTLAGTIGLDRGCASIRVPLPLRVSGGVQLFGQWLCIGTSWPGGMTQGLSWRH